MTTQAQTILDAATSSSLANDSGLTPLANTPLELLGVLNRRLAELYTLAAMPKQLGGMGRGDFFATSTTLTLSSSPVALPTGVAFVHSVTNVSGTRVAVVPQADVVDGFPELPPAVRITQNKVLSLGRSGDPVPGDVLTLYYTPLPGSLTLGTDYIGATTPSDSTTTVWPSAVGDPYLVAWLSRYLAYKASDRDPDDIQHLESDLASSARSLGTLIGVEATRLSTFRPDA